MLAENLLRKLGIRPGMRIALENPPAGFRGEFEPLLSGVEMADLGDAGLLDLVLWWPGGLDKLDAHLAALAHRIHPEGAVWLVLPKKPFAAARGIGFTWDAMQAVALKTDLVDNKTATVSATDYGTRFVIRKDLRRPKPPLLPLIAFALLAACTPSPSPVSTLTATAASQATDTAAPTYLPSLTPLPPAATGTSVPTGTPTPTESSTPDPYYQYTIDYLTDREYGGGEIEVLEVLAENGWFTRYLVRYPSDGLWIYGFLNVPVPDGPAGPGPYPVIIALHGYIDPSIYGTLDYTTGYADALARAGYFVLHPNLRGYRPSDEGENLFRVGMAIDVLNLIALVRDGAADPELLAGVDTERIGLWGHSMGGGISTRVITVTDKVQAAVLYAPMSGDERQNWEAINGWSGGLRGLDELAFPESELPRISPVYFFDRITAAVSIHHGRADELVPLNWSIATCDEMNALDLDVRCTFYDGMPHTFYGEGNDLLIADMIGFFDEVLKDE